MSTQNEILTAGAALNELLEYCFNTDAATWREVLADAERRGIPEHVILNDFASLGFLRRWFAPLLTEG